LKNLPNDLRFISLKYDGRCQICAKTIRVGQKGHWSPNSKKVWCRECVRDDTKPQDSSKNKTSASTNKTNRSLDVVQGSGSTQAGNLQTQWVRLCQYAQRCIEAEAAKSLVPYVQENTNWFVHMGEERLVVGQGDSIPAPDYLAKRLSQSRLRDGQSMLYGWPTVVITDRDHSSKVAPLFVVNVSAEQDQNDTWELYAAIEPEFNLAITSSNIFDPAVTEDIHELLNYGLPFGDADAFNSLADQTSVLLGLKIQTPLDPFSLDTKVARKQGVYNSAVSVVVDTFNEYQTTLREELLQLQTRKDWVSTSAAHLLGTKPELVGRKREPSGPIAAPLACNESQEKTLESLHSRDLTVVTGPPGTGKTQLVVNAVINAWLNNETVLVTSTNNAAVDVAVDRAEKDICSGLLIRTGNRATREQIPDRVSLATSFSASHRGNQSSVRAKLKRVTQERVELLKKLSRLDDLNDELLEIAEEREELRPALNDVKFILWGRQDAPTYSLNSCEIERRAERLMRAWLFRRFRIRRLFQRVRCKENISIEYLANWARIDQRMKWLTSRMEIIRAEQQQFSSAIGNPANSIKESDRKWSEASLDTIRTEVAGRIRLGSARLSVLGSVSAGVDRLRRAIANSFPFLKGWACTALSANSNFNLESGLFDLVIIDEASQCSLATMLPLAYRAKRLVLVGDPNQLNPINSLSDSLLKDLASQTGFENIELRERGIHHKDGSAYHAFEYAAKPSEPVLLNEHFRCHPHIARWFNTAFYNGDLTVLTDVSNTAGRHRAVFWYDIEGVAERPRGGSWINEEEAKQTVEKLVDVLDTGYQNVGVVTPFTAQARLITRLAQERLGQDVLDDFDFVSGTAHRLQGDEREVIVFSSVLSPGMSKSSRRWVEKERNLLNVAVSRAKQSLIVIGHPDIGELGSPTLSSLRTYLRDIVAENEDDREFVDNFRTDSRSEELLLAAMQLQNLSPYTKLNVEGYEIDFALLEFGIKLNVEVDGDHHLDVRGRQRRQDVTRDRVLSNLGWKVLRISAWRCFEELDAVIDEITAERDLLIQKSSSCITL